MKSTRHLLLVTLAFALATAAQAQTITGWNFNSPVSDADTSTGSGLATSPSPSFGAGTAVLIGGTTANFTSGSPGDTSSPTDNSGWNTTGYPASTSNSGTAGVQFNVSTAGFFGPIQLTLDFRQSGTASRYFQLQVSSDGVNFAAPSGGTAIILGPINSPNTNTSFSNTGLYANSSGSGAQQFVQNIQYTFAAGSPYSNDPNFAFRWVSVFDPANNTSYTGSNSTYATGGTARFDLVTVAAVPEPSAVAFIIGGFGLLILGRRSLRRS